LNCKYCDRSEFGEPREDIYDYNIPKNISFPIESLKSFIKEDDYLTFYGGEPLMAIKDIQNIMATVKCKEFMLQTNGILLNLLGEKCVKKLSRIPISIDGDEKITDANRGQGVHKKIMDNLKLIKKQGFKGELVARMTITKGSNLYEQVIWLLSNGFENIHWQLDVMFYNEEDINWLNDYNQDVTKLMNFWLDSMKTGKVIRLYPFIVIMEDLLKNKPSKLRCGSGHSNYTILTNGKIVPCPIMQGIKQFYCGDINHPEIKEFTLKSPCKECNVLNICGGRCLHANCLSEWKESSKKEVCSTVKHLIDELQGIKPAVEDLLKKRIIKIEDFSTLKFNGTEIIP
jgi:putative peptide-modifying radical SAM enzyme